VAHKYLFLYTPNSVNYLFSQPSGYFTDDSSYCTSESLVPIIVDPSSGEGLIHRPNEQYAEDSSEWSTAGPLTVRF